MAAKLCSVEAFYKLTNNAKSVIKMIERMDLGELFSWKRELKCEISIETCHSFCTFPCWKLHVWGSACTHAGCTAVGSLTAALVEFTWEAQDISEHGRR